MTLAAQALVILEARYSYTASHAHWMGHDQRESRQASQIGHWPTGRVTDKFNPVSCTPVDLGGDSCVHYVRIIIATDQGSVPLICHGSAGNRQIQPLVTSICPVGVHSF